MENNFSVNIYFWIFIIYLFINYLIIIYLLKIQFIPRFVYACGLCIMYVDIILPKFNLIRSVKLYLLRLAAF